MSPAVSIITPTFNRHALLAAQHANVLAQSEQNFEWLILDDGPAPAPYAISGAAADGAKVMDSSEVIVLP